MSTLYELLESAAERWPDRVGLEANGSVWRYGQLLSRIKAAICRLGEIGLEPRQRFAVATRQGAALWGLPFICSGLGAPALPLAAHEPVGIWRRQLRLLDPTMILADRQCAAKLESAGLDSHVIEATDPGWWPEAKGAGAPPGRTSGRAPSLYLATSGTAGASKLVGLHDTGFLHATSGYLTTTRLSHSERSLIVLPLHYVGPISTQSLLMPMIGGTAVLAENTAPSSVAVQLDRLRITHLDAAPNWLQRLPLQRASRFKLRTVIHGGSAMPRATSQELHSRLRGTDLYDVWGLTEAHGPITIQRFDPSADCRGEGAVGRPLPGLEVRAVPQTQAEDAGCADMAGELWVRGPSVASETLGADRAGDTHIRGEWLATGDVGHVAPDGSVHLRGRIMDTIVRGGVNVVARDVERVLTNVSGVTDAAVVGMPSSLTGETVVGVVVTKRSGPSAADLRRAVRLALGASAVPAQLVFVSSLGRSPTGKVDRGRLRDLVLAQRARER